MEKRGTTRRARVFEARTRYLSEPGRHADVRRKVILPNEGWTGEIAQIECLYRLRRHASVCQGVVYRLHRERTKIAIGECSKSGFPDADYGNRSHINLE